MKVKFTVICQHGDGQRQLMLPGHYVVCPRCRGKGSHVNPAVDGHGISAEEFAEDPDFAEGYFSGRYDVSCEECRGERVVAQIDLEKLPKALRKRIEEQLRFEAQDRRDREREEFFSY